MFPSLLQNSCVSLVMDRGTPRWCVLLVVCGSLPLTNVTAVEPVNFDRQIRAILSENCFHCHGPDAASRQADLRLDVREGALANGAIQPGKPAASEIVRRIRSQNPDEQMPPPQSNRHLTDAQKQLLEQWIAEGAPWSEHWSFVKPMRPAVPAVKNEWSQRNAIDAFIQATLSTNGMAPSPEADRARLLRRVTLDLTGLPPTLDELQDYLADTSPDAYDRAVDRLLASPRYGERMVWDWLDAARYADTNGYQGDPTRPMWYWRDWATAALNANQPFDQFSIEQLAGDLLPEPTRQQLIATGFHRNHMINGEGGRIAEESRIDYVQDRVETTGTVWMGLTLNCCRCHDHKFDPLPQRDYYRLAAYFNSIDETGANDAGGLANPVMSLATEAQQQQLATLRERESQARDVLTQQEQEALPGLADWEKTAVAELSQSNHFEGSHWTGLLPTSLASTHGTTLTADSMGIVIATGENPTQEVFTATYAVMPSSVTALRLEALPDESLPASGPGRAENGNFVLTEIAVKAGDRTIELAQAEADFEQTGWPASQTIDGNAMTGWAVQPQFGQRHTLLMFLKSPLTLAAGETLTVRLAFESPHAKHVLGKFRLSGTTLPAEQVRGLPTPVRDALTRAEAQRTDAEKSTIRNHYLSLQKAVTAARAEADKARGQRESFERSLPRTMVMRERATPRETFILVRGAYDKPAEKVEHGTPSLVSGIQEPAGASRLGLARWLMSSDHPLTSRVVVNRIWQTLMGTGIVKTADDFGAQGEKPSHPELLDWLAVELMEQGWDVKHIQRLIVTSATYRQTSKTTQESRERDPENRLYSRSSRYRWPSWMVRDQALAVSGLLEEQLGGPPVKGYQPEGIWEEATFGNIRYQQDSGTALYRRSLYQFWRRIVGPTVFFDVSSRQACSVKQSRTNTPLQALVTLNDVTYVEAARCLAERVFQQAEATDSARLELLYQLALSRTPTAEESQRLLQRKAALAATFAADPAGAASLLKMGSAPAATELAPTELAAWTSLSLLVLNLDEALCKE